MLAVLVLSSNWPNTANKSQHRQQKIKNAKKQGVKAVHCVLGVMLVLLLLEMQGVSEVRRARGVNSYQPPRFAKKLISPKKLIVCVVQK